MDKQDNKHEDIDALLSGLFRKPSLREQFDKRLHDLGMSQKAAEKLLKIERRTLNGILDGTQKRANFSSFQKIATFLNMPIDEFAEAHASLIENNFSEQNTTANKKKFLKENFDLAVLRNAGFISSINNFEEIENKIVSYFGFTSIFEYKKRSFDTAFFSGIVTKQNEARNSMVRDFWLTAAKSLATKIDNPNVYDRQQLINYFPSIRWHSTNVEFGLINVIKALYRMGITVIYQPSFPSLHLRGATFAVNNKPCIVLTDYRGFYPTLWHCLIHELYHVLFDLEEILVNSYHLSEDESSLLTIDERETEANEFARKYFFAEEKMAEVAPYIRDSKYVKQIAKENNVHYSMVYVYYAFDNSSDRKVWARAKAICPDIRKAVFRLENGWSNAKPIDEIAKKMKLEIYN